MFGHVRTKEVMSMVSAGGSGRAWERWAACAMTTGAERERFFPTRGEDPRDAIELCRVCPVASQCLAYALVTDERWGVWGGLTTTQRDRLEREMCEAAS